MVRLVSGGLFSYSLTIPFPDVASPNLPNLFKRKIDDLRHWFEVYKVCEAAAIHCNDQPLILFPNRSLKVKA